MNDLANVCLFAAVLCAGAAGLSSGGRHAFNERCLIDTAIALVALGLLLRGL